jgi:2,3-bisphosphoglycerate-independent phosphoglycerate mutase
MKFALVIPDGCADEPQASLGGLTPLQAARTPAMDEIARLGAVGRANNVPEIMPSGSDVATMSLFGYDPLRFHTGRAPLEAAAQGIELGPDDWAIRCNFVTVEQGVMKSFTAGQIASPRAAALIALLNTRLGAPHLQFFAGVSYRNLLIWRGGVQTAPFSRETSTTPPHDFTGQSVAAHLPAGPGSQILKRLLDDAARVIAEAPASLTQGAVGQPPATGIWLWGLGRRPAIEPFHARFGCTGAMITAVDLLRGMAALLGWKNIVVPGATGYLDTDYRAKGRAAIRALDEVDLAVVHVEATDEASHEGNALAKIDALERIDRNIVAPLHNNLRSRGEYRLLVSPDHPTFLRTRTHSHGFVPFTVCGTGVTPDSASAFDERTAAASKFEFSRGCDLMPWFLRA